MNLDELRQKIVSQTKTVEVGGCAYRIQKLSAVDGLAVDELLRSLETEGEGDAKEIKHAADLVRLYSMMVSKSLVDDQGKKTLDSDDARDALANWSDLIELGHHVSDWHSQKKS